jgi:hypothetical protein
MKRVCLFGIFVFVFSFFIGNVACAKKLAVCVHNKSSSKNLTYMYHYKKIYTGIMNPGDDMVTAAIPKESFDMTLSDDQGKKVYHVKGGQNMNYCGDINNVEINSTPTCFYTPPPCSRKNNNG